MIMKDSVWLYVCVCSKKKKKKTLNKPCPAVVLMVSFLYLLIDTIQFMANKNRTEEIERAAFQDALTLYRKPTAQI